jgi:hypothetical protein
MIRSLFVICLGLALLHQAHGATSTFYGSTPYPLIQRFSTPAFKPTGFFVTKPIANDFVISPDGTTAYFLTCGPVHFYCPITAMDLATGKIVHKYHPLHNASGPMALLPNGSQLWVATCSGNPSLFCGYDVEVFDVGSEQLLGTISTGNDEVVGLQMAPNGATVYVVHANNNQCCGAVTAVDVATLQTGASLVCADWDGVPVTMVISGDGATGYLECGGAVYDSPTYLYAVDLTSMTVGAQIPTPEAATDGSGPMAVSANGALLALSIYAYVPDQWELLLIDTATQAIIQTIPGVSGNNLNLMISPDGSTVYFLANGLQTLDVQTGAITTVVSGEAIYAAALSANGTVLYLVLGDGDNSGGIISFPEGTDTASKIFEIGQPSSWLAAAPNGQTLYSANPNGVSAVSLATGTISSQMLTGVNTASVAVSADGATLYAVSTKTSSLTVIDASTGTVENTVTVSNCSGDSSGSIALTPNGGWAFVGLCGSVIPINLTSMQAEKAISGTNGTAIAINPEGTRLYASTGDSTAVIALETQQLIGTIPIAGSAIAFGPRGGQAYIAGTQNKISGLAAIDTTSLAVTSFTPLTGTTGGESIGVTADGSSVYLVVSTVTTSPVVAVVDTQTMQVVDYLMSGSPFVIE